MRFLQLRQELAQNCTPFTMLNNDLNDAQKIYCYDDFYKNQNNSDLFISYHNIDSPTNIYKKQVDIDFKQNCINQLANKANISNYDYTCEILNGFNYSQIPESRSYSYNGELG